MARLIKSSKVKKLNWPAHTGHSEHKREKFDRHGRKWCRVCKKYTNECKHK